MREFVETWLNVFYGVCQGTFINKVCPIYIWFCIYVSKPLFLFILPCVDPYVFKYGLLCWIIGVLRPFNLSFKSEWTLTRVLVPFHYLKILKFLDFHHATLLRAFLLMEPQLYLFHCYIRPCMEINQHARSTYKLYKVLSFTKYIIKAFS